MLAGDGEKYSLSIKPLEIPPQQAGVRAHPCCQVGWKARLPTWSLLEVQVGLVNHLMGIKVLSSSVSHLIRHHHNVDIRVPYYSLVRVEVYIPYLPC